ncbi:MAG: hypothetical protein ACHQ9S_14165 [Candidatus Binatia bacterium]
MNSKAVLRQVILDLHGLEADHLASVPVHAKFDGGAVWRGIVEVFRVNGHPHAARAYAWSYTDGSGRKHHIAVPGVPPINGARDAVRVAVVTRIKKQWCTS